MNWTLLFEHVVAAIVFGLIGILMFVGTLWVLRRVSPFSIEKELAEDQNIALGIVMAAMLIGLAIILASALSG